MTAADFTPWISPAALFVLFAWLRMDLGTGAAASMLRQDAPVDRSPARRARKLKAAGS